jgi:hypothetical protein
LSSLMRKARFRHSIASNGLTDDAWRDGTPYAPLCAAWYDLAVCRARCRFGGRHHQMPQASPGS